MFCLEDLPNELFLIIFSYLKKYELIKSFYELNKRLNSILFKFVYHINLSSIITKDQLEKYLNIYSFIYSLTIDNYQIGNYFFEKIKFIQLENLYRIKLIDNGIHLLERIKPDVLNIVITSLNYENKFLLTSLKRLEIEFQIGEYAKKYFLSFFF
jgi:hypothetical protein